MIIGAVALVAIGLVFAGVGYAYTYTGTVNNTTNTSDGEYITVDLGSTAANYSGFVSGVYTLNSSTAWNDGAKVTFSALKKDGTLVENPDTDMFKWENSTLAFADTASGYTSTQAGSMAVHIHQSTGATLTPVKLTISGLPDVAYQQYGMSLVYTYQYGENPETIVTSATLTTGFNVALTSGEATVTVKAYVVYNDTAIPLASVNYTPFVLNNVTVAITATAGTA